MKKVLVLGVAMLLAGCATKTINPVTGQTESTTRGFGERFTDMTIERQILNSLEGVTGLTSNNYRVAANAYRGEVLLTGEVPSREACEAVARMAGSVREVTQVYNRLKVLSEPKSQSHTLHENYLKTKLVGKMLSYGIRPAQYNLVVRDDLAYLMGALTSEQVNTINNLAKDTDGILGFVSFAGVFSNAVTPTSIPMAVTAQQTWPCGVVGSTGGVMTYDVTYPNKQSTYQPSNYPLGNYPQASTNVLTPAAAVAPIVNNPQSSYVRRYQGTASP